MWRKLLGKVHPDANGDHELFIWAMSLRETICDGNGDSSTSGATTHANPPPRHEPRHEPRPNADKADKADRIPFDTSFTFSRLTVKAMAIVDIGEVLPLYADLLRLLADCEEFYSGPLYDQQKCGASYKQLAAIGHRIGMSKERRIGWYRLAESIPLSMRHAGHILKVLSERAA
jgi:hypothetical protein